MLGLKKIVLFLILIALSAIVVIIYSRSQKQTVEPYPADVAKENDSDERDNELSVEHNDVEYNVGLIKLEDRSKITFRLNLIDKRSSAEAYDELDCRYLVNGGFYTKENTPLGLFIQDGKLVNTKIISNTFNSFVTIDDGNNISLLKSFDDTNPLHAFQTGPLLVENGSFINLSIKNDKASRRIVLIKTDDGLTYFAAFYIKNSLFSGPSLADLPEIVEKLSAELGIPFQSATNLDGGTASAFISDEVSLTEASTIGSYFCIK